MPNSTVDAPRWPAHLVLALWVAWLLFVMWLSRADWGRPKMPEAQRPRAAYLEQK